MFIFYLNNILSFLDRVNISMFADDCVPYIAGNTWNSIRGKLQHDLEAFVNWTNENSLALNISKTKTKTKHLKIEKSAVPA